MNNKGLEQKIIDEISAILNERKSLILSSLNAEGEPYASYAPYALGDNFFYILISELAEHTKNLQSHSKASILIIEDENQSEEIFARLRISYAIEAQNITTNTPEWQEGLDKLQSRHGDIITALSQMSDFKLFKLNPINGRYVKGFGKTYQIEQGSLMGSLTLLKGGLQTAK